MRRRTRVIAVAGVVLMVWFVAVAFVLATTARHLQRGRDGASAAIDGLQPSTLLSTNASAPLATAASHFRAAHRGLRNPLVAPLRAIPVIGRQIRSVDASAATAGEVVGVAGTTLRQAQQIAERPVPDGSARLSLVNDLAATVHDARRRLADLHLGPDEALVGPIRKVHVDLVQKVRDARDALSRADNALVSTQRLLQGPSQYLVIAANNAEMRSGSGMWLSGGVLTTDKGRLTLGKMAPIYEVANLSGGGVTVEDKDLRANWSWMEPAIEWRSLMASPRFPAWAAQGVKMWTASGHPPVDGVVVVDAVALGHLVNATGPVTVGDGQFDGASIVNELLHDQYVRFDGRSDRHEALSDVASEVFHRLDSGSWDADALARELTSAVRGRHLLIWATDPAVQRGWDGAGASGPLHPNSLAVSLLNIGGNKLDWFVDSEARLTTERRGSTMIATATVTFTNRVGKGEPTYVAGPFPGLDTVAGEYKGVLAIEVPGYAKDIALTGVVTEIRGNEGPTQVVGGTLRLRPGESLTVRVTFRVPHSTTVVVEPSARMPGISWTAGSAQWTDDRAHSVAM